jgi:peptidoglycan-N-acetylglucosamine deacetylase
MSPSRFDQMRNSFKKSILSRLCGTITHVRSAKPVVALTFDDGPDPEDTPKVLHLLNRYNVHATFFMLGVRAAQNPEIVAQVARSGHSIGNHGWSHTSLPSMTSKNRRQEIKKTQRILAPHGSDLFRPPFGHMDWPTYRDLLLCGYRPITWNVIAYDWTDRTDKQILSSIDSGLNPGSIVLLHDSLYTYQELDHRDREPMLAALEQFIQKISTTFSFLTIPELLKTGRANKIYWLKRGNDSWLKSQARMTDGTTANDHLPHESFRSKSGCSNDTGKSFNHLESKRYEVIR